MAQAIQVDCPRCGKVGEAYNDGENFERLDFGHHGPATKCLSCNLVF